MRENYRIKITVVQERASLLVPEFQPYRAEPRLPGYVQIHCRSAVQGNTEVREVQRRRKFCTHFESRQAVLERNAHGLPVVKCIKRLELKLISCVIAVVVIVNRIAVPIHRRIRIEVRFQIAAYTAYSFVLQHMRIRTPHLHSTGITLYPGRPCHSRIKVRVKRLVKADGQVLVGLYQQAETLS